MKKKIICLDFDGVIHSYVSGWKGPRNIPDPPVEGAIEAIADYIWADFTVVIHSSRARYFGGIWAMRKWLKQHAGSMWYDGPFMGSGLEKVQFTRWKPSAFITLDDRAITFTGTWPKAKDLRNFQPWHHIHPNLLNDNPTPKTNP